MKKIVPSWFLACTAIIVVILFAASLINGYRILIDRNKSAKSVHVTEKTGFIK